MRIILTAILLMFLALPLRADIAEDANQVALTVLISCKAPIGAVATVLDKEHNKLLQVYLDFSDSSNVVLFDNIMNYLAKNNQQVLAINVDSLTGVKLACS